MENKSVLFLHGFRRQGKPNRSNSFFGQKLFLLQIISVAGKL
jgi:hypothetical protein